MQAALDPCQQPCQPVAHPSVQVQSLHTKSCSWCMCPKNLLPTVMSGACSPSLRHCESAACIAAAIFPPRCHIQGAACTQPAETGDLCAEDNAVNILLCSMTRRQRDAKAAKMVVQQASDKPHQQQVVTCAALWRQLLR